MNLRPTPPPHGGLSAQHNPPEYGPAMLRELRKIRRAVETTACLSAVLLIGIGILLARWLLAATTGV